MNWLDDLVARTVKQAQWKNPLGGTVEGVTGQGSAVGGVPSLAGPAGKNQANGKPPIPRAVRSRGLAAAMSPNDQVDLRFGGQNPNHLRANQLPPQQFARPVNQTADIPLQTMIAR